MVRGSTGSGGRLPNTEVAVEGRLDARGTAAQPIRFEGFVPDEHSPPNSWGGIYLDSVAGDFVHVGVTTAQAGIRALRVAISTTFTASSGAKVTTRDVVTLTRR